MKANVQTWARAVCGIAGAVLAGPTGTVVGTLTGGLLATILPGASVFIGDVVNKMTMRAVEDTGKALAGRLAPVEKQRINHDLQTAFRDAFLQAVYDMGGQRCFPHIWSKPRDVPPAMIYPLTHEGEILWRQENPLAGQACSCLHDMERALSENRLLPMDPPADQPAASVRLYVDADTPQALSSTFFDQVLAPFLSEFRSLMLELPSFEAHLRQHLLDRTLVHLGEMLKQRAPAWRAFNRLMLEELRDQVQEVAAGQTEMVERIEALLQRSDVHGLPEWSNGVAELLAATGQMEKQVSEGLGAVLERVVNQHGEVLARFDWLIVTTGRIESKVDRVLRFLEDGRWVIEGAPPVQSDQQPEPGEPPFRGLQCFDQEDATLFFGREMLTARLAGQLHRKRFLIVVGASGSGKSSVLRAGLLPALQRNEPLADGSFPPTGSSRWPAHVITPTSHPLDALAASLTQDAESVTAAATLAEDLARDPRSLNLAVRRLLSAPRYQGAARLMLVVDQFEELFTQCRSDAERRAFVDNLLWPISDGRTTPAAAAGLALPPQAEPVKAVPDAVPSEEEDGPVVALIALRADFYEHCARFPGLRDILSRRQEYIGPMSEQELRRAIEEPARQGSWEFERGLVDLILRDVGDEPGALPLLSHALLETWKHRRGRVMTLESYAESGGVRGAIAKTADSVYHQQLNAEEQAIARSIFLRLTEPGEGTQDTRRRAALSELTTSPEAAPAIGAVLQRLADARLVTTGKDTAEVAHEALIREWPTLRRWLDENRAGLRVHRRLTEAAHEWEQAARDEGLLYRGTRLAEASEWAVEQEADLNPLEREFLTSSQSLAEREAAERTARQQRELEAARKLADAETRRAEEQARAAAGLRRRALYLVAALSVAGVLAVLALVFAQLSGRNAGRAQDSLGTAQVASNLAIAQEATAEGASTRAVAQQLTAEAASTLAVAEQATAQAAGSLAVAEANTRATAEAIALQQKATAEAASAESLRQSRISVSRELAARSSQIGQFNPDLATLLAVEAVEVSEDLGAAVPEAQTALFSALNSYRFSTVLRGHGDNVMSASFSPDGSLIATTSDDGSARLWRIDGTLLVALEGHTDQVPVARFSPDGQQIVTASWDGTAKLWRTDGTLLTTLEGHLFQVQEAMFSPDGKQILTASWDGTARLWTPDGTVVTSLEGHGGPLLAAAFSPDGTQILTASFEGMAWLWQVDGTPVRTLEGHTGAIWSVAFSQDRAWIATASEDGTVRLWRRDGTPVAVLAGHEDAVNRVAFSPDSTHLVTASSDGTAKLWRSDGALLATLAGHEGLVLWAGFSPDGAYIVTTGRDGTARLWLADGKYLATLKGHDSFVYGASFSPDARWIATASEDDTARLWAIKDLYSASLEGHDDEVTWAGFSPDGSLLATTGGDGSVRLWRADGGLLAVLDEHEFRVNEATFSPDGTLFLTASDDNTARLWRSDGTLLAILEGHTDEVYSACFSPDGSWIATASKDGTARLWRSDGTSVRALEGHESVVWSVGFSPDSSRLLTASSDQTARLWQIDGTLLATLQGRDATIWLISFSPDGSRILTAGTDDTPQIWEADGTFLHDLQGHSDSVWSASFSPDGLRILTASADGTARLWQSDGTPLAVLTGHKAQVRSASFSPDGKWIVTAGEDGTARLWTADGQFVAALEGHTSWVTRASFSPDSSRIVTASWDYTARLWSVRGEVPEMLATAKQRVGRTLTDEECLQYLPEESCPLSP